MNVMYELGRQLPRGISGPRILTPPGEGLVATIVGAIAIADAEVYQGLRANLETNESIIAVLQPPVNPEVVSEYQNGTPGAL